MDAADATHRGETTLTEPPSLLTIILDTNPHAWTAIESSLPLSKALATLLVFVNAHLAINPANKVAVLASHVDRAEWLFPFSEDEHRSANGVSSDDNNGLDAVPIDDANKYRPFAKVEHAITTNLRHMMSRTTAASLNGSVSSMIAGALTRALAYISKQVAASSSTGTSQSTFNYSDPDAMAGNNEVSTQAGGSVRQALSPRVLLVTLSPDAPEQYIPVMNSIFAAQRLNIPLDVLPLTPSNKTFLQQAADATQGIYLPVTTAQAHAGLLQYLMFAYLPDLSARKHLISASSNSDVDFRAACFCHQRIIDLGFVCSICLSIFCEPVLEEGKCLTCSSDLRLGDFGRKPAVIPRKKKKRRPDGGSESVSDAATPMTAT